MLDNDLSVSLGLRNLIRVSLRAGTGTKREDVATLHNKWSKAWVITLCKLW